MKFFCSTVTKNCFVFFFPPTYNGGGKLYSDWRFFWQKPQKWRFQCGKCNSAKNSLYESGICCWKTSTRTVVTDFETCEFFGKKVNDSEGVNSPGNFILGSLSVRINKTGTSQVGAISKAQKAQNIFLGKKLEIFEKKILSEKVAQCRKMWKGDPFWFINTHSVAK